MTSLHDRPCDFQVQSPTGTECRATGEPTRSVWLWVNLPFLALVMLYRLALAPLMSGHCRFQPTCSRYALEAYLRHNPIRASWLTLRRLARCHPWGGGGFDPVD